MEEICRMCEKQADATCICDSTLRFCYKHFAIHLEAQGNHKLIPLIKYKSYNKYQ